MFRREARRAAPADLDPSHVAHDERVRRVAQQVAGACGALLHGQLCARDSPQCSASSTSRSLAVAVARMRAPRGNRAHDIRECRNAAPRGELSERIAADRHRLRCRRFYRGDDTKRLFGALVMTTMPV
jgi:hypothetical protein